MDATFFKTQELFRKWLEKNHLSKTELVVGYYKVKSGKASLTWPESVDQALCFGWIDGVRKTIDEESYCIRFTPRNKKSIWSAINIKKMEALQKAGLMRPEGLAMFENRIEGNSKIYSYENEPVKLSAELEKEFCKNKKAWEYFIAQAPSYKKLMVHWIMNAKQEKTQLARLEKTIQISEQQKRMR